MAKDRDRRYASTSDLLMDLEAIQAGQPPLQARSQIKAGVLKGLTAEAEPVEEAQEATEEYATEGALSRNCTAVVVILSAALAVSIMLNIFLLASK